MVDPERLLRLLARRGPSPRAALAAELGVSQPTFSRLARACGDRLLVTGKARKTRYAARRTIEGVDVPIPVVEIRPPGEAPRRLLSLHPVAPDGFWVEGHASGVEDRFYDDLPWFLNDLRPTGFLGRLVPRRHPDLPSDIQRWSSDDVLRWATRWAWNPPGALVAGHAAFRLFLSEASPPSDAVPAAERAHRYPQLAANVLAWGPAGSSAGGERPKFLATRVDGNQQVPVLVKFSPPGDGAAAVRTADLLVAEHLALDVLAEHGRRAARSELLFAGGRAFLEVERFDRQGMEHRSGVVSLVWADAEWVGSSGDRWVPVVEALVARGRLDPQAVRTVRWLEAFGRWIANTDMHGANLALELDGTHITGVAPAYDMAPMAFAPRAGEVVPVRFEPPLPDPADADVAVEAWEAARDLWRRVAGHRSVSPAFREVAADNAHRLDALAPRLALLPTGR